MRTLLLMLALLFAPGCLYGQGTGTTTTQYAYSDGVHRPVTGYHRTTSSGRQIGAGIPLVAGYVPMVGGGFGAYGMIGSSTSIADICLYAPDTLPGQCPTVEIATMNRTTIVSPSGGPDGNGQVAVEDKRLSELLAKHQKAIAALVGQQRVTSRLLCQVLTAHPEVLTDKERKVVVDSCAQILNPSKEK